MRKFLLAFVSLTTSFVSLNANACQDGIYNPDKSIIDKAFVSEIKRFVDTEIVRLSIENQNVKYDGMSDSEIVDLDNIWRAETGKNDQPLISATLSNPLSSYLTRVQAHSIGLYSEIFVMDENGLNVGQSNISSDYWQGDEAKFQKTHGVGSGAVFIDDPELDDDLGICRVQVNMSVDNAKGDLIGAITVEVNLSEFARRKAYKQK